MEDSVDDLLEERRGRRAFGRTSSLMAAGGLHLALLLGVLVAPRLAAQRPAPPEFVAVQIVPLQTLGTERPAPPKPPAPTPPKSEPVVEQPKPVVEPVMPEPAKPVAEKPVKKPEPTAVQRPTPPEPSPTAEPSDVPEKQGSDSGATNGTSAFGAQVATLDNPDFTYGYYIEQMLALIRAQWVRPPLGGGIEATVHFLVGRTGEVAEIRIVQSSGYSSFDLAGLRAIQTASPLPPLPSGYKQGSLGVTLIIR